MRAVAYARFSSDDQREESIDAQMRAIKEYAARNDIVIIKEYTDEAQSARSDRRPAFQRMFTELPDLDVQIVLVHKLDRFSRDRYDTAFYKRQLKQQNIRLISVLESNLDDSPESIILESVLTGMSEYYSANLAREVMKGMRETAYKCKHTGGVPPYGYRVLPDRSYEIVESEAAVIRMIFDMYASGRGYSDIIAALEPYRTRSGNRFGKNSLHDLLINEKYIGTFVFNRAATSANGKRNNHASKPSEDVIRIPGGMPRIVDDDTWSLVQERIHDNKHKAAYKAKAVYLLSGKLFCGLCGASLVGKGGKSHGKQFYRYMCGSRAQKKDCTLPSISKDLIEGMVIDEIEKLLAGIDIDTAAADLVKLCGEMDEPAEVIAAREDLHTTKARLQNLVIAIRDTGANKYLLDEMKRLTLLESSLEKMCEYQREVPTIEEMKLFLRDLVDIRSKDQLEQKRIIGKTVDRIVVYPDRPFDLHFRVPIGKGYAYSGGGGESRTPVRKPINKTFYEHSRCFKIPFPRLPTAGSAFR